MHPAGRTPVPIALAALLLLAACGDEPTGIEPRDLARATVAAGTDHSCALDDDGAAWCWGSNRFGQLGAPDVELFGWTPAAVAGGRRYASIVAATSNEIFGPYATCALTGSGEAYCWGRNSDALIVESDETCSGVAGDVSYSFPCVRTPTRVAPALRFAQLSVGAGFICGVTGGGEGWCWGRGDRGQLGNDALETTPVPSRVTGDHRFAMIAAGERHACGLDADGALWCWGDDAEGQLGRGTTGTRSAAPVRIEWPTPFRWVDAGDTHGCAIETDGDAVCWGSTASGRLGAWPTGEQPPRGPVVVQGGHDFRTLSAGVSGTCGITSIEMTVCWGGNFSPAGDPAVPFAITASVPFDEVWPAVAHGCGRADGDVWCWGNNEFPGPGQLGVGEQVSSSDVPLAVSLP